MNPKIDPSKNPTVEHHVRQFLHELNSGGGKPLETLTPAEARQVLVSAQKGATLPPCDVEDRMVEQDALEVKITIVRPKASTGANFETDSYNQYDQGYFLTKPMMKWFWDAYTTDPKQRKEIYASPLQATTEQLKGLPPAMVQTAGNDVLRDEGEAYARKLDETGVDVTAVRYEGLIHDYGLLNALSEVPAVRDALHQAAEMLRKHLK